MKIRLDRKKLMAQMIDKDVGVGELAEKADISISTLSGIRAGRSCSPKTAKSLALALGVPIERLAIERNGGEG